MKKILCFMLCALLILSSVSALAATNEFGAYSTSYGTNIFIRGKLDTEDVGKIQQVTILFLNESTGDIGYIDEMEPDKDGFYKSKFKFVANSGDCNGYEISVRDSATSRDITGTLQEVTAQKDTMTIDIDLNVSGDNDIIKYVSEGELIDLTALVNNEYGNKAKVTAMLAVYDANNKLLDMQTESLTIGFADLKIKKTLEFDRLTFPADAVKAKAFIWQDTQNLMPFAEDKIMLAYGESRLFENKNENQDEPWVVGFTGASTVQAGYYQHFMEQYYATRYPEKNIVFVNKGCPGYTAKDIYDRLNWDIFNENDPLGYGECDEIVIMVGANDLKYSTYANGKMDEDDYEIFYDGLNTYTNHYNSDKIGEKVSDMTALVDDSFYWYTMVVEECKTRGKKVVFTPMTLYDDSEEFEHILYDYGTVYGFNQALGMLSDKLEKYAEEQEEAGYPITFIDTWGMSDEYTEMIRTTNDESVRNYYMSRTGREGYVFLGKDGLHHSAEGGYIVGYIIARGQETDPIVASVEIADNGSYTTEDAEITDVTYSSTGVAYSYSPKALPMYAAAVGYVHGENLGIDITGTINREIIKVAGLEEGTYSIKMADVEVATATAEQLAAGVNIATLDNNPGQIQAADIYNFDKEAWGYVRDDDGNIVRDENGNATTDETDDRGRRLNEIHIRQVATEELAIRKLNYTKNSVDYDDPIYADLDVDGWCELAEKVGRSEDNIATYRARKENIQIFIDKVKANIEGTKARSTPGTYEVVITKN